ncbi:hypothetical protein [Roseibium sp.]|uniref:hypothetical protein n=1 Tax=Roseibium sp. TaxID=1936156 RepID=UPI003A976DE7
MTNKTNLRNLRHTTDPSVFSIRNKSTAQTNNAMKLWLDDFTERMAHPGPQEEEFFARRRQLNLGAGLDENGNLVKANTELKD